MLEAFLNTSTFIGLFVVAAIVIILFVALVQSCFKVWKVEKDLEFIRDRLDSRIDASYTELWKRLDAFEKRIKALEDTHPKQRKKS